MSRVDDDRDAARLAERIMQEKKLQEGQAKKRQEGASAFQKLMQQPTSPPPAAPQTPAPPQGGLARAVLARATQEGKTFGEKLQQQPSTAGGQSTAQTQKRADTNAAEARSGSRVSDSREDKRTSETRDKDLSKSESAIGQVNSEKGAAIRADADAGGGKGSGGGGKDKKEGGTEMGPGFRFNPALMAPVPVAKPKDTAGSERLRAIATEIAQKIVERVRVGTNAAGNAEFQIDLRGDVLNGLSIKVSAKNGKISATFSGSNRDVLKLLEEHREGLKTALGGRGLKLEDVKFEAKT
ncbi:flagellar hook-length control protein FliK [Pyxidicoccus xibeiensis]|uniref:flagellar hook-length control protein FliK n=1 Tax=Pyxidicoccus xibeiensis TaxID=2906759 RepID=UPI0020A74418|nr:flagellar hook-length control protein FliK [Pyxidicoccus xibeiensis]MCP3141420.1 flagellar hook-length control protein FliK [Pyxidicoccus xibeiensis]